MKIDKQIVTTEQVEIAIDKITLLSIEEHERCKEHIQPIPYWWWLRSPVRNSLYAAHVNLDGSVYCSGSLVNRVNGAVRPVVVLRLNPESDNLRIDDKFILAGHTWTVIDSTLALCDEIVGTTYFRKDWKSPDANVYEQSHVKKWLERWVAENGIEFELKEGTW